MMRQVRFAGWMLRKPGRLMAAPDALLATWLPPCPIGWAGYRALRSLAGAEAGASNAECVGDRGGQFISPYKISI